MHIPIDVNNGGTLKTGEPGQKEGLLLPNIYDCQVPTTGHTGARLHEHTQQQLSDTSQVHEQECIDPLVTEHKSLDQRSGSKGKYARL